jgi:hypothetical protein
MVPDFSATGMVDRDEAYEQRVDDVDRAHEAERELDEARNAAVERAAQWETRVGVAGKRYEASVKTPAGKLIRCGKFASEAAAWQAAQARVTVEKSRVA